MSKLPNDLVEISSYNGRGGVVELNGLMYSPSEKALYNKGFLNKKININNKRNFYSYIKSENPRERKRICINLNSFLKQYPQYECIKENKNVENNIYGDRKQELPTVKEVTIETIQKSTKDNLDYYNVLTNVSYEKDMGYPTKLEVTLTYSKLIDSSNNYLEIIKIEDVTNTTNNN